MAAAVAAAERPILDAGRGALDQRRPAPPAACPSADFAPEVLRSCEYAGEEQRRVDGADDVLVGLGGLAGRL